MTNHVVVCGFGQVGSKVVSLLCRAGESVTVVAIMFREDWLQEAKSLGAEIVEGDARNPSAFRRANLHAAKALIVCTDDDLVNIEIALDARRHRPDLRIVARIFDQNLATRLEEAQVVATAMDVSSIAAPSFASAAYGGHIIKAFHAGEWPMVVGRIAVTEQSFLAGLSIGDLPVRHNLAPLAVFKAGKSTASAPEPFVTLQLGDEVEVVSLRADFDRCASSMIAKAERAAHPSPWKSLWHSFNPKHVTEFAKGLWKHTPLQLRAVFLLLNLLILFSVAVFQWAMGLSPIDALYFVVSTVTTVGYGDITPRSFHPVVKLYACMLMVLGSAMIAVSYSILTDFIVRSRLQEATGRHKVPDAGHIVLAGIGNVGFRTARVLQSAKSPLVLVESEANDKYLGIFAPDLPIVIGDARDEETLRKAGIEGASAIIAATNNDAINLSIGLAAKKMNPDLRAVVRIFDSELATKIQSLTDIDVAISAPSNAASSFAGAALDHGTVAAFVLRAHLISLIVRPAKDPGDEKVRPLLAWTGSERPIAVAESALRTGSTVLGLVSHPLSGEEQQTPPE